MTQAEIPERRWTKEILPLLAELGSVQACFATRPGGFGELLIQCLRAQYAPEGRVAESQARVRPVT